MIASRCPRSTLNWEHLQCIASSVHSSRQSSFISSFYQRTSKMKLIILFLAMFLTAAHSAAIEDADAAAARTVREGANTFALDLFKNLALQKEENLIVSPWSLTSALLMLREGAKGASAKELQSTMNLPSDIQVTRKGYSKIVSDILNNNSNNSLDIANALFPNEGFTPLEEFTNTIKSVYKGEVETVNYRKPEEAAAHINSWADKNTRGLIKKVVSKDSFSPETALLLANAVFFKGLWKSPFESELTVEEKFYPNGKKAASVNVQMMKKEEKFLYGDFKDLKAQALALPYDNDKFYMLILLPYEDTNVNEVISKMTSVEEIKNQMHETTVIVSLPRFKIESDLNLNKPLNELGIVDVFSSSANLTGITEAPLRVSDVIQKAVIEVNEEGTKAAAVTVITLVGLSALVTLNPPPVFMVDRPFVTFIVERESEVVLFSSKIVTP